MILTTEQIAKVCYGAIQSNLIAVDLTFAHTNWESTEAVDKEFCLAKVQFYLDNPEAGPEQFHDRWMEKMRMAGWKHNLRLDKIEMGHPYLIPYQCLPDSDRMCQEIFCGIVRELSKLEV